MCEGDMFVLRRGRCRLVLGQARKLLVLTAAGALTRDESAFLAFQAGPLRAVSPQHVEDARVPARRGIVQAPARRVVVDGRLLGVDVRLRFDLSNHDRTNKIEISNPPPTTMIDTCAVQP